MLDDLEVRISQLEKKMDTLFWIEEKRYYSDMEDVYKHLKVLKLRENSLLPKKAHQGDAGFDVYYCPPLEPDPGILGIWINPGDSVILETGIAVKFDPGYTLEFKNRSGMAAKRNLIIGACLVDEPYRNELMVNLHNIGNDKEFVEIGERIAQFVVYKIEDPDIIEISKEEYDQLKTDRGKGFGSSGKF